eukprot:5269611-Alexandrium_andersonii.AAC.1
MPLFRPMHPVPGPPSCWKTSSVGQHPMKTDKRIPGTANACSSSQRFAAVCSAASPRGLPPPGTTPQKSGSGVLEGVRLAGPVSSAEGLKSRFEMPVASQDPGLKYQSPVSSTA